MKCTYPDCNCPFDAPADPNWCARGLPKTATPNDNVIKFPAPTGEHLQGPAKCLRCKHEWQVVAPTGNVGDFECPSCGCYTGVITALVEPAGLRWQCECENQLFFLDNKGPPMCASCGKRAHEWIDA